MRRTLLDALLMAGLCAAAFAARILWHGEIVNERSLTLVALAGAGGALATLWFAPLRPRGAGGRARLVAGLGFGALFVAVMALLYVLYVFTLSGRVDAVPGDDLGRLLRMVLHAGGYFLAFSPAYLLPWVLPLISLLAGLILPRASQGRG